MNAAPVGLVLHVLALADDGIVGVSAERTAGRIIATLLQLALHVIGGTELQAAHRLQMNQALLTLVGAGVFPLGDIDHGEGAERVDGYAGVLSFDELVADLVEHSRQHRLDGGLADAGPLDDTCGKTGKKLFWTHETFDYNLC